MTGHIVKNILQGTMQGCPDFLQSRNCGKAGAAFKFREMAGRQRGGTCKVRLSHALGLPGGPDADPDFLADFSVGWRAHSKDNSKNSI